MRVLWRPQVVDGLKQLVYAESVPLGYAAFPVVKMVPGTVSRMPAVFSSSFPEQVAMFPPPIRTVVLTGTTAMDAKGTRGVDRVWGLVMVWVSPVQTDNRTTNPTDPIAVSAPRTPAGTRIVRSFRVRFTDISGRCPRR